MASVLSEEQLNVAIENYLTAHKDEIQELVDKKIALETKRAISEAFKAPNRFENQEGGLGWQLVNRQVGNQIKQHLKANPVEINADEVSERVAKQVAAKVKKVRATIEVGD